MIEQKRMTIATAHARLKQSGLRKTIGRISIVQFLASTMLPKTQSEIAQALTDEGLEGSTIYRSLNDLVKVGIVRRLDLGDHIWRFSYCTNNPPEESPKTTNHLQHSYFICTTCNAITHIHVEAPELLPMLQNVKATQVNELFLRGQCNTCGQADA